MTTNTAAPTASPGLIRFFGAEARNTEQMRRDLGGPGSDEYEGSFDADDDLYIPEDSLATAKDSWVQAPDDILAEWLGLSQDLTPEQTTQAITAAAAELDALIEAHGPQTLLDTFVPA